MKTKFLDNTPEDVWKVWVLQTSAIGVGMESIKFIEATIEKYPEYFEWEHKFKAIPESVYEAYLDEVYPDRHERAAWTLEDFRKHHESVMAEADKSNATFTNDGSNETWLENLKWFVKQLDEEHDRKIAALKEEARKEGIWNKHFKKYKLKYRSDNIRF
jgi:hypothetical protein